VGTGKGEERKSEEVGQRWGKADDCRVRETTYNHSTLDPRPAGKKKKEKEPHQFGGKKKFFTNAKRRLLERRGRGEGLKQQVVFNEGRFRYQFSVSVVAFHCRKRKKARGKGNECSAQGMGEKKEKKGKKTP